MNKVFNKEGVAPLDLQTNHFATLTGVQAQQFGRDIYSAMLKFKDLERFLRVFPEVQRGASSRKINKIKAYILTSLEDSHLRFFSSLTVTTRGNVFFDVNTNRIAIDTSKSKLSINDGQHRFYGINEAIRELKYKAANARSVEKRETYAKNLEILENMSVPLVIFNQIDEVAEKQLFYDLNNLSSKPSKNVNIRLAQSDMFSRLAREVAEKSFYLQEYGVEVHKQSIHVNNPNTVLLTTVYAMCKNLFINEYRNDNNFINNDNFDEIATGALDLVESIFKALPKDLKTKGKYIIDKSYCLRGIAAYVQEHLNDITTTTEELFQSISNVNWTHDFSYWSQFGTVELRNEVLQFPGNGEGGVIAIKKACSHELTKLMQ